MHRLPHRVCERAVMLHQTGLADLLVSAALMHCAHWNPVYAFLSFVEHQGFNVTAAYIHPDGGGSFVQWLSHRNYNPGA